LTKCCKRQKNRKSPGLDNINVELFKFGGQKLRETLLHLFNNIWKQRTTPSDWEEGLIINIYKKGSRNVCNIYRGITLLSTASKLFANIHKNKVNKYAEVILDESQYAFRKGRGCIDPVFTLKQIIEKRKEYNQPLYLVFIDCEKAYDNVNRNSLWEILEDYNIPKHLIEAIKSIYNNTKIRIKLRNNI
jgi:hypothetical protein